MSEQSKQNLLRAMAPKSDQLNADDLIAGPRVITITHVKVSAIGEQLVSVHYENDCGKPWKPSKGMMRVMAQIYGDDPDMWVGRSVELYRKEDVRFGKDTVGGIRIKAMSHIAKPLRAIVTVSRGKREEMPIAVLGGQHIQQQETQQPAPQEPNEKREWAIKLKAAVGYGSGAVDEIWAKIPVALQPEMESFYKEQFIKAQQFDAPPLEEIPMSTDEELPPANIESF